MASIQLSLYPDIIRAIVYKVKKHNILPSQYIHLLLALKEYTGDLLINYLHCNNLSITWLENLSPDLTPVDQTRHFIHTGFNLIQKQGINLELPTELIEKANSDGISLLILKDVAVKEVYLWFMSCVDKVQFNQWWLETCGTSRPSYESNIN